MGGDSSSQSDVVRYRMRGGARFSLGRTRPHHSDSLRLQGASGEWKYESWRVQVCDCAGRVFAYFWCGDQIGWRWAAVVAVFLVIYAELRSRFYYRLQHHQLRFALYSWKSWEVKDERVRAFRSQHWCHFSHKKRHPSIKNNGQSVDQRYQHWGTYPTGFTDSHDSWAQIIVVFAQQRQLPFPARSEGRCASQLDLQIV